MDGDIEIDKLNVIQLMPFSFSFAQKVQIFLLSRSASVTTNSKVWTSICICPLMLKHRKFKWIFIIHVHFVFISFHSFHYLCPWPLLFFSTFIYNRDCGTAIEIDTLTPRRGMIVKCIVTSADMAYKFWSWCFIWRKLTVAGRRRLEAMRLDIWFTSSSGIAII